MLVHQLTQLFVKGGNNLEGSLTAGDDSHVSSDNFCKIFVDRILNSHEFLFSRGLMVSMVD